MGRAMDAGLRGFYRGGIRVHGWHLGGRAARRARRGRRRLGRRDHHVLGGGARQAGQLIDGDERDDHRHRDDERVDEDRQRQAVPRAPPDAHLVVNDVSEQIARHTPSLCG